MKIQELNLKNQLFLSLDDIAKNFSVNPDSAKVTINRYIKRGLLFRIKRNLYITPEKLNSLKEHDLFHLANFIQIPSYVSLISALSYYNITTQQLQGIVESVAQKRSRKFNIKNLEFRYFLVKKDFYNGFSLESDIFIASPEKALSDIVYLTSLGKYSCDFDAVNFSKIDKSQVRSFIKASNKKTELYWEKLCRHYKI